MKKVLALALALVLTLSMGTLAFAANKSPVIGISAGDYTIGGSTAAGGSIGAGTMITPADSARITKADIDASFDDWTLSIAFTRGTGTGDSARGDYKISFKKDEGSKYFDVSWDSSAWKIKVVAKISYSWSKDDSFDYAFTAKFRADGQTIEIPVFGKISFQGNDIDNTDGNIKEGSWYYKPSYSGVSNKTLEDVTLTFDGTDFEVEFSKLYDQSRVLLYYNTTPNKDIVRANMDADLDFVNFPGKPEFSNAGDFIFQVDEDKYIYEIVDGKLVPSSFRWDDEIGAWKMRGTVLGSYVVSDIELKTTSLDSSSDETDASSGAGDEENNPGTGANDVVGVAAAMAVISLVAAGAVAFKKASK